LFLVAAVSCIALTSSLMSKLHQDIIELTIEYLVLEKNF
jgi:hypothetical protein